MEWRIFFRKEMRVGMPSTWAHTSSISIRCGEISTVPTQYKIPRIIVLDIPEATKYTTN
jgi:hypothetical protein